MPTIVSGKTSFPASDGRTREPSSVEMNFNILILLKLQPYSVLCAVRI